MYILYYIWYIFITKTAYILYYIYIYIYIYMYICICIITIYIYVLLLSLLYIIITSLLPGLADPRPWPPRVPRAPFACGFRPIGKNSSSNRKNNCSSNSKPESIGCGQMGSTLMGPLQK